MLCWTYCRNPRAASSIYFVVPLLCYQGAAAASSFEQLAEQLHGLLDLLPEPTRCLLNILWISETAPLLDIQVSVWTMEVLRY
jgi:hypothetical protein